MHESIGTVSVMVVDQMGAAIPFNMFKTPDGVHCYALPGMSIITCRQKERQMEKMAKFSKRYGCSYSSFQSYLNPVGPGFWNKPMQERAPVPVCLKNSPVDLTDFLEVTAGLMLLCELAGQPYTMPTWYKTGGACD